MTKNHKSETKQDTKKTPKTRIQNQVNYEVTDLAVPPMSYIRAAGGDTIQAQADRLNDSRINQVQLQELTSRIGRDYGNRHLHDVIGLQKTVQTRSNSKKLNPELHVSRKRKRQNSLCNMNSSHGIIYRQKNSKKEIERRIDQVYKRLIRVEKKIDRMSPVSKGYENLLEQQTKLDRELTILNKLMGSKTNTFRGTKDPFERDKLIKDKALEIVDELGKEEKQWVNMDRSAILVQIADSFEFIQGSRIRGVDKFLRAMLIDPEKEPKKTSWSDSLLEIAVSVALAAAAGPIGAYLGSKVVNSARLTKFFKKRKPLSDATKTLIADPIKQATKSIPKLKGRRSGEKNSEKLADIGIGSSVFADSALSKYVDAQIDTLENSKEVAKFNFLGNAQKNLQDLPIELIYELMMEIRKLSKDPEIAREQEVQTGVQWVNFKARWIHGADKRKHQSVLFEDVKIPRYPKAVLNVGINIESELTDVIESSTLKFLKLSGVHMSLKNYFRENMRIIDLKINKVFRFNHRTLGNFAFQDIKIRQKADGGLSFECSKAGWAWLKARYKKVPMPENRFFRPSVLDEFLNSVEDRHAVQEAKQLVKGAGFFPLKKLK